MLLGMQACAKQDLEGQGQLQVITAQAAAFRCAAHAEAVAGEATEAEGVRKGVGGIQLAAASTSGPTTGEHSEMVWIATLHACSHTTMM